jgi:hypothetical protein
MYFNGVVDSEGRRYILKSVETNATAQVNLVFRVDGLEDYTLITSNLRLPDYSSTDSCYRVLVSELGILEV